MRVLLHPFLSLCLLASAALAPLAHAESYPNKPVRVVVAVGGGKMIEVTGPGSRAARMFAAFDPHNFDILCEAAKFQLPGR